MSHTGTALSGDWLTENRVHVDTADATQAHISTIKFTFVNQAEDLLSIIHRKLSNIKQRHDIRSHVMQHVRKKELSQGKKRPTGRSLTKYHAPDPTRSIPSHINAPWKTEPISPMSVLVEHEASHLQAHAPAFQHENDELRCTELAFGHSRLSTSPSVHEFDPFQTLPSNSLSPKAIESLLQYCFDTLLPMTFLVESKSNSERLARQEMVLWSKTTNPAMFLGFMATVAAHRAINRGYHRYLAPSEANYEDLITDPDYRKAKHEAIVAIRQTIEQCQMADQHLIDACFALVSNATVVGNFDEARVHLHGIAQMVSLVGTSEKSMSWLPVTNVKVFTAMLSPSFLTIPWTREDIPEEILQRISPPPGAEQSRLGTGFSQIVGLSDQIKDLLSNHRDICNICEFSAAKPSALSAKENSILNRKATELEYDFVAYPYQSTAFPRNGGNEPVLSALEAMVRLAGLGLLSITPHAVLPSLGMGRAITHHQKRAVERWLREKDEACRISELSVVTWALFIFIQCSELQPEQSMFIELLAQLRRDMRLQSWRDIESTMYGFLYIPQLHATIWKDIWADTHPSRECC